MKREKSFNMTSKGFINSIPTVIISIHFSYFKISPVKSNGQVKFDILKLRYVTQETDCLGQEEGREGRWIKNAITPTP